MMSSEEENEIHPQSSEPKPIPKQPALQIDKRAQSASFVSQRSSSFDTFGSVSPTDSGDDQLTANIINQDHKPSSEATSLPVEPDSKKDAGDQRTVSNASDQQWLCNDEAMPASMLHPNHRSSPVKTEKYLAGGGDEAGAVDDEDKTGQEGSREVFLPGDLQTPITGFETMEARSKFTVYKIQVHRAATDSNPEPSNWFIFRRYSDFLHLNERLKLLFPGFRLALPPKRWFRDNYDTNFLEDRMLGLQAFLDNITGHKDICNSTPVRGFLCTDDPPGPHDSLEESRALCDTLEETMYSLRQELQDKDGEIALLREELALYKSQVELLSTQLKAVTGATPTKAAVGSTPAPSTPVSSLAECDLPASPATVPDSSIPEDSESDEL